VNVPCGETEAGLNVQVKAGNVHSLTFTVVLGTSPMPSMVKTVSATSDSSNLGLAARAAPLLWPVNRIVWVSSVPPGAVV